MALAAVAIAVLALAAGATGAPSGPAPDGPGALSHFDLARKDCLGTARNTTSKVWFTVADGVLSDVYYPTIDNTNVETLQYVVTDGSTFTDLQTRDMTSTARALDDTGMACEVTSTPANGKYRIVTDYVADPSANAVLMRVRFTVDKAVKKAGGNLRLYLRFDPTVNGNGGGGGGNGGADSATTDTSTGHAILVASDPSTATNAANRDYAQPVYAALDGPFAEATNGFAGTASDGLTQLDASRALTTAYTIGSQRQRRPDSARRGQRRPRLHGVARLRIESGRRGSDSRRRARRRLLEVTESVNERLGRVRRQSPPSAELAPRIVPQTDERAAGLLLRECQRAEGVRGQDVPRRDRREPRPRRGDRRSRQATRRTRTSAPTARSSRATSTRSGPG